MILLLLIAAPRLISLSPTVTEIVCALDACEQLVGVTRFDDYPPQVLQLPKVGGYADPSFEATVRLKPDLVLLNKNGSNQNFVAALDKAHIKWLAFTDEKLADFAVMTTQIGDAIGKAAQAKRLIAKFDTDLARLKGTLQFATAIVVYGHRPLILGGPGTFGAELLALAGSANAYKGSQKYPTLDLEALVTLSPRLVIDVDMISGAADESFYSPIRALLDRRGVKMTFAPDPALLRLGPRLPVAMLALVQRL